MTWLALGAYLGGVITAALVLLTIAATTASRERPPAPPAPPPAPTPPQQRRPLRMADFIVYRHICGCWTEWQVRPRRITGRHRCTKHEFEHITRTLDLSE